MNDARSLVSEPRERASVAGNVSGEGHGQRPGRAASREAYLGKSTEAEPAGRAEELPKSDSSIR